MFGKGQTKDKTTLTNPCKKLEKYMYQFAQIHVTIHSYVHQF